MPSVKQRATCAVRVAALVGVVYALTGAPVAGMHPYVAFPELVHTADVVFTGKVINVKARWGPNRRMIFTDVTFGELDMVNRKASARGVDQSITLSFAGGELDGVGMEVSGVPQFNTGERYVLFGLHDGETYANPLVGGTQGVFRIVEDPQTGQSYPLAHGSAGITGISEGRLQLTAPITGITGGNVALAAEQGPVRAPAPMPGEGAPGGVATTPQQQPPDRILTVDEFIVEVKAALAMDPPVDRAVRGLGEEIARAAGEPVEAMGGDNGDQTPTRAEPRKLRVPERLEAIEPADDAPAAAEPMGLPLAPESTVELGSVAAPPPTGGVAGTALCYCGYHDLHLVMEQHPAGWWSWQHNNDAMWQWNQFMDVYRYVDSDGTVGNNNDNEFSGWPDNATLNNIWGFNWGTAIAMAITYFPSGCPCCELSQSDLMFNPAYSWWQDFSNTLDEDNRVLYRPVVMHELGHTWGYQRGSCTEDYSYNRLSVMHAYYSDLVEDGWGIHATDAWAIRDLYNDQTSVIGRVDLGVESYYASSGLINSTTNASTYFVGDPITVQNLTVENMSSSSTPNVRIRLWLSSNNNITTSDHQMGGYWFWDSFPSQSWWTGNLSTTIPDVPAGTYYVGAIVTVNGSSYSLDDLSFNNDTFLFDTIEVKRRPANDLCGNAVSVSTSSVTTGTTIDATTDGAPFCSVSNTSPGVWYRVTGNGYRMTASTCSSSTNFDTKISVYCGSCSSLNCVAGNDDMVSRVGGGCSVGHSGASRVSWCSQKNATYYILVHGFGGATGNFRLSVSNDGEPCSGAVACGGVGVGACCAPQVCEVGGTCRTGTPYCNANFSCYCFRTAEGDGVCMQSHLCSALTECPNGTSDCADGEVCTVDTCCSGPVCAPVDCPTALAVEGDTSEPADGLTPRPTFGSDDLIVATGPNTMAGDRDEGGVAGGNEGCFETDAATCVGSGGIYQGTGTRCETTDCNPPGACCLPDGSCIETTPGECVAADGDPQGPETTCAATICPAPEGACCAPDEGCTVGFVCGGDSIPTCNGVFGCVCATTADGNILCVNGLSACGGRCPNGDSDCLAGQRCFVNTCCNDGTPTCIDASPCPPDGTVATAAEGVDTPVGRPATGGVAGIGDACLDVNEETCLAWSGAYQGDLTFCADIVCNPVDEACCFRDGSCVNTFAEDCTERGGSPQGPDTTCSRVTCPVIVACCLSDGRCGDFTEANCLERGGTPLPPGVRCEGDADGDGRDDACQPDDACEDCGPGDHFVDSCEAGNDIMNTGALIGLDTNGDCQQDTTVRLNGPVHIRRSAPLDTSGVFAGVGDADGHRDVIDTEIVSMELTGGGMILTAGGGLGIGGVLDKSLGAIVEQPDDPAAADSFFDVFVEIQLAGGGALYNHEPLRVKTKIDCLPPDATYIHPDTCLPLYRVPPGEPSEPVANLVRADHQTFPCGDPRAGDCFIDNGTPYCDHAECCERVCTELSYCCERGWDAECAGLARQVCEPVEACCLPDDTCRHLTVGECKNARGEPQGGGSRCSQVECRPLFACCLPDGRCADMPREECRERDGRPLPEGTACEGDGNDDGIDDVCQIDEPCSECGPGPHWVDECPAGEDSMPSSALIGIDLGGDCTADTTLRLTGPSRVRRSDPQDVSAFFPEAGTDDGHRDVIDTEIVALDLVGNGVTLTAGRNRGIAGVLRPSRGAIVEQDSDSSLADSFFDVFFEVQLPDGSTAYNHEPVRVRAKLDCLPPDTTYIHPRGCVKLFSSPVPGEGEVVAYLVTADHSTYPACGDEGTGDCFEPHPTPFCKDETCCRRVCEVEPDCCAFGWAEACVGLAREICTQTEACCLPDGTCVQATAAECRDRGGVSQGPGTSCDNLTCEQPQACCLPDGACAMLVRKECRLRDGTPLGPGTRCLGSSNKTNRDDACALDSPCADCGGTDHWVDTCPSGSDIMPSLARLGIDTNLDCEVDTVLQLNGAAAVWRSDPRDDSMHFPGLSQTDGHRDVIDTELVGMALSGSGARLLAGGGFGQGGILRRSLGALIEQPTSAAHADSFFDIWVELQLPDGSVAYNLDALRMRSKIDCTPPQATFVHPRGCVPLYSSPIEGRGEVVANLVEATNGTFPLACGEQEAGDCFDSENTTPFCDNAECCRRVCEFDPFCCREGWGPNCAGLASEVCEQREACCLPDGTCEPVLAEDCQLRGGIPQGFGSTCDNVACPQPQACCLPEGRCAMVTREECLRRDGTALGRGTICEGDADGNGRDDACQLDGACEDCGPGEHWVDQCAPGADNMPSAALLGIDTNGDCEADTTLRLVGPISVWRSPPLDDSMQFPGLASVDNHRDVIDTEIVAMSVSGSGVTLRAGAGQGAAGALPPSLGAIVEQPNDPSLADSFFDVFAEFDLGGGTPAYNHSPLRMGSKIDCLPPDALYIHPGECIPLFDVPVGNDGRVVANLVRAASQTFPGDDCAASRDLSQPRLSYCPGFTKTVRIALNVPAGTSAVAVEDSPPANWTVSNISDGGVFDSTTGKVKWGPFFAPFPTELTYDVTPPDGKTGTWCFRGTVSLDGVNQGTCGDDCLDELCCPAIPADVQQPLCNECSADCSNCAACEDHRVELCEMTGYACMWRNGCNDNLAGMTRAAFIWKRGECYCFDDGADNWVPAQCPAPQTGCCVDPDGTTAGISPAGPVATVRSDVLDVVRNLRPQDDRVSRRRSVTIPIEIEAPEGAVVAAVEYAVPEGWQVTIISDEGQWDAVHGKVKWGPFFERLSRRVSFTVEPTSRKATLEGFAGTVSIDGVNYAIESR